MAGPSGIEPSTLWRWKLRDQPEWTRISAEREGVEPTLCIKKLQTIRFR
jgi:hypothetical protein